MTDTQNSDPTLPIEALSLAITSYVACTKCAADVETLKPPQSMQQYAQIDAGFTDWGVQIWCRRHKVNIVHIDFLGQSLPADFRRLELT